MKDPDPLAWHERFFLDRVRKGLALAGGELAPSDEAALLARASNGPPPPDDLLDRAALALRDALDEHIRRYPEEKRVTKHIGVPVPPPVVRWREAHGALRRGSDRVLALAVDRWRREFYRRQWLRSLRAGGLLP